MDRVFGCGVLKHLPSEPADEPEVNWRTLARNCRLRYELGLSLQRDSFMQEGVRTRDNYKGAKAADIIPQ